MRPQQIVAAAREPGLVLVPVSPAFEWHSLHLPVGTDAIIVEEIAQRLALHFHAVYFRALSMGLDEWRGAEFKAQQGLDPNAGVFGMNYPDLPLGSEYVEAFAMQSVLESRLRAIRASGFRLAVLLNHHGGCGQFPLLDRLASTWSADGFHVLSLNTRLGEDFQPPPQFTHHFEFGGHAGIAETLHLMAFRPDLVDTNALPEGPLSAANAGILHHDPEIPASLNPRRAQVELAQAWGQHLLTRFEEQIYLALKGGEFAPDDASPPDT